MMSQWDKQNTFKNPCSDLNNVMLTLFSYVVLQEEFVNFELQDVDKRVELCILERCKTD